jgi:hypothetical protein
MKRREFLKTTAATMAGGAAFAGVLTDWVNAAETKAVDTGAVQTPGAAVVAVETVAVTLSPVRLTGPRLFVRMSAQ